MEIGIKVPQDCFMEFWAVEKRILYLSYSIAVSCRFRKAAKITFSGFFIPI